MPFVDGLRAVAVLAVVGFHIELPGFSGGFVGVDVFFVISGFLIINQIRSDLELGRFSILSFYARRTLRILPPFIVMLVAVYCLAPFVLPTPAVYLDFALSSVSAPTVFSNIFFYFKQGYFDLAANQKPLLHTWTLAVEDQFYFVAPVLLMSGFYFRKKLERFGAAVWMIAIVLMMASLAGAILKTTVTDRNPAFYLMHWRAWEFIAGGMIAPIATKLNRAPRLAIDILACIGLAAIVFAVTTYDAKMPYPSWRATVPVFGAFLFILSGEIYPRATAIRVLAGRVPTAIGLVSYGWYLWHWPLLSFMRIDRLGDTSLVPDFIGGGVVALLLACASYVLIEKPIRRWGRRQIHREMAGRIVAGGVFAAISTAVLAGVIGFGAYAEIKSYVADRYGIEGVGELDNGCRLLTKNAIPDHCLDGDVGIILGDSDADALSGDFTKKFAEDRISLVTVARGGCSPLIFAPSQRKRNEGGGCSNLLGPFERLLTLRKPLKSAIIHSTWDTTLISDELLTELVTQFDASTRLLVIGPVPQFYKSSLDCVVLSDRHGQDRGRCTVPRSVFEAGRRNSIAALRKLNNRFENLRFVDPVDLFCDETTCSPFKGNHVFYRDFGHVTPLGAEHLRDAFREEFDWVVGKKPLHAEAAQPNTRQPAADHRAANAAKE